MRIFYLLPTLLSLLLLTLPAPGRSESGPLQPLLGELQAAAEQTQTLASNFVQEKNLAIFSEKLLSQGRFFYQAPDRLRWELLTPVASGFVLRGGEGERWNSLSQERTSFSVENDPIMGVIAQQLLAWARVDLDWLQRRYQMRLMTDDADSLRLTPLDQGEAGFIDYFLVQFAPDRRYIAAILLVEQGGDSTRIRFTDVQLNKDLPKAIFQSPELQ